MRNEDVKIGMKVVPFQKTVWNPLETSVIWNDIGGKRQGFLYVNRWNEQQCCWVLNATPDRDGDFFAAEDFHPYRGGEIFPLQKLLFEGLP